VTEPTQIVTASTPGDFIATIPALLGYRPVESLVVVPLRGTRSVGAIRIDLDNDPVALGVAVLNVLAGIADVTATIVVTYSATGPRLDIVDAVSESLEVAGCAPRILAHVADDGWSDYLDHNAVALPLPESAAADGFTADQRTVTDVDVDPARAQALATLMNEAPADPSALTGLVERVATGETLTAEEDALLARLLNGPLYRDAAIIQWATDAATGARALTAQMLWETGIEIPADISGVILGLGTRPDPSRVRTTRQNLSTLAAHLPAGHAAGAYVAAAWLSWAAGHASAAAVYLDRAVEHDDTVSMISLLRQIIDAGFQPEWSRG
jgi:hypothetical protein